MNLEGKIFRDNDPRMRGRLVRIVAANSEWVYYRGCAADGADATDRRFRAQARRFYVDGKARRAGFSLVAESGVPLQGKD